MKDNPLKLTVDFQKDMLKFIVSARDKGVGYLDMISPKLFDDSQLKVICECLQGYRKVYNTIPGTHTNLWQFFLNESGKSTQISQDTRLMVERAIYEVFTPYAEDSPIMVEHIVKFAQFQTVIKALDEHMPNLYDGVDVFNKLLSAFQKAVSLTGDIETKKRNQGTFLVKDRHIPQETVTLLGDGDPTFLHALNKMRTTGGFMAPEIIVVMSGPKFFKTGLIMNFIKYYLAQGKKVYWADTENGVKQLKTRIKQCLLKATYPEMKQDTFRSQLASILDTIAMLGGDFLNDFYSSNDNINSIDRRLTQLNDEFGWRPDIIVIDDPDKLKANDLRISDPTTRISEVYKDMLDLNAKWGCFSFVPSQVGRAAINKKIIKVKDMARDISKSHTAHCIIALCRTETDMADGLGRVVMVLQREGEPYQEGSEIPIKIDGGRMHVEELDHNTKLALQERWRDTPEELAKKDSLYD